ncbi:MAG: hypothetical protein C0412_16705 [Flavobacterium sp.]|nr:hypothetical protein [Flavobacterium sp.]
MTTRYPIFVLFFVFLIDCSGENIADQHQASTIPESVVSEHFTFTLYDGLSETIKVPVLTKLEENYARVLRDLNLTAMNKVTIKIWNDETHFYDVQEHDTGVRYPGSTGYVAGPSEIRILNRGSLPQTTLHEFCHAASLVVNRSFGNNPRWFWEAIAIYEAGELTSPRTISYLVSGNFPTIEELTQNYNAGNYKIYQVGYLLSEYILANWGNSQYIDLIKYGANIQATLGVSVQQFEAGWKHFVQNKYLN